MTPVTSLPRPLLVVAKTPCPQGVDEPLAREPQALPVTESGSNKLCLPHLSLSILDTVTATTLHFSGRAAGHGGCG